jgi:uncharacterized membrane protein
LKNINSGRLNLNTNAQSNVLTHPNTPPHFASRCCDARSVFVCPSSSFHPAWVKRCKIFDISTTDTYAHSIFHANAHSSPTFRIFHTTQRPFRNATAVALITSLLTTHMAFAQSAAKEKCYGIAEVGQNDCANASGTHSCAGQSKVSKSTDEWKYVAKGACKETQVLTTSDKKVIHDGMKK